MIMGCGRTVLGLATGLELAQSVDLGSGVGHGAKGWGFDPDSVRSCQMLFQPESDWGGYPNSAGQTDNAGSDGQQILISGSLTA